MKIQKKADGLIENHRGNFIRITDTEKVEALDDEITVSFIHRGYLNPLSFLFFLLVDLPCPYGIAHFSWSQTDD